MRDTVPVTRVKSPTDRDLRRLLRRSEPLVVAEGASGWPAAQWTPEILRAKAGSSTVLTHRSDSSYFGLDEKLGGPKLKEEEMTLDAFVSLAAAPESGDIHYYLQRASIPDRLPALLPDLRIPSGVDAEKIYLVNLWFGPANNITRLHYDVPNNFLVHFYGRKRIVLFAPRDSARLYPFRTKAYNMSQVDIDNADLQRFPKLADARPYEAEIGPGDMLYIPPYWWHQVYSLELGISANYWWMPRPSQYLAPQLPDVFLDVARVLKQRFLSPPAVPAIPKN
jgi:Cupin-like domain